MRSIIKLASLSMLFSGAVCCKVVDADVTAECCRPPLRPKDMPTSAIFVMFTFGMSGLLCPSAKAYNGPYFCWKTDGLSGKLSTQTSGGSSLSLNWLKVAPAR